MAFNVNDFKSKVRDLAKQFQFEVEVLFPIAINPNQPDLMNILCQSTSIPGVDIAAIDVPVAGAQHKIAGEKTYPDWTVTFRVDDGYEVYKNFRAWAELIKGTETNIASFPAQYKSNPIIYQLSQAGDRVNAITLNGAWPTSLGEISVDWTVSDIQTFDVTFAYDSSISAVVG